MHTTSTRITELVGSRLYAVGGVVPLDGSISWAAPLPGAVDLVSLYVLKSRDSVLVVDTGLPIHRDAILDSVRSLVGDAPISIILTRVEPDTVGNLFALLLEFDVEQVTVVANAPNPFEFANSFRDGPLVPPEAEQRLVRIPAGDTHSIAGFDLELIRAPLRVLSTVWLFLESDGVLFTSDVFGYVRLGSPDAATTVTTPLDDEQLGEFERQVSAKFGWLAAADAESVLDQADAVLDARSIRIVAPTHGRTLCGEDVFSSYRAAIRDLFTPTSAASS